MKILVGILVIVLTVFLNSAESSSGQWSGIPLRRRSFRVWALSDGRQPARVGRPGRSQSRLTTQSAAAPSTPESANGGRMKARIYIEDPQRGFIKLTDLDKEGPPIYFIATHEFVVGIIEGENIVPIFNEHHDIIRIDYIHDNMFITMDEPTARSYGVFGTYADFCKKYPYSVNRK